MTPKTVLTLMTLLSAVALVGCGDNSSSNIITPDDPVVDTVPPAVPTGVALSTSPTQVQLSWVANAEPDLAGYVLERSLDEGETWEALSTVPLTTNAYTDFKNRSAQYRVAAEDLSENRSAYSPQVGYWLDSGDPKVPAQPDTPQF